jgi:multiple sugar transport system substrate-binding protein
MLATLLSACTGGGGSSRTPVLNFYDNPDSAAAQQAVVDRCNRKAHDRYRIRYHKLPTSADQQRLQLVRRLAAHDSAVDILGLDVTWEAEFAEAGWVRPWTGKLRKKAEQGMLAGPLKTATWHGNLVGVPFNSNTQLLWYRSDLVPHPPKTWDEMIKTANKLAKHGKPHYIEQQGAQYEGLTVWFNSLVASGGGSILNAESTKPSLGKPALRAAQTMKKLATSPAADPSLSNQQEDDNRLRMEAGKAAFEVNYPFVWPSMQDDDPVVGGKHLKKVFKWAPYPKMNANKTAHSTIGGIDLAVGKYSPHPKLARKAILCMSSVPSQRILAVQGGLPPVGKKLYDSPPKKFAKAYPFYKLIGKQLAEASVRPKTPAYQSVSIGISHLLSPPDEIQPEQDIDNLHGRISKALKSEGLIP